MPTEQLFYFSHLKAVEEDMFGPVWFRKKEFAEVPYAEEAGKYASHMEKFERLA